MEQEEEKSENENDETHLTAIPRSASVKKREHPLGRFAPFFDRYGVAVPLSLYVASGYLFFVVFQSIIFHKVCLETYSNQTICNKGKKVHADNAVQTGANHVLLVASVALTVPTIVSVAFIGSLSDKISRKGAILLPFVGAIISDICFLIQAFYEDSSPLWFVFNQFIFGLCGGYSAVFSSMFAKAMSACKSDEEKSKTMGILQGLMGLGGTVGYFSTGPLLKSLGYVGVFAMVLSIHVICILWILLFIWETPEISTAQSPLNQAPKETNNKIIRKFAQFFYQAFQTTLKKRPNSKRKVILGLLLSYSISYLVLFGSQDITFYYLKHELSWGPDLYGYLSGSIHALSTVMTLILYRMLKNCNITDTVLALLGLISRCLGRAHLALIWSTWSVFILIGFDMFSRFGATSIRSLLSQQVPKDEQGKIFAMMAILDASCNLMASVVFNAVFPATLTFLPQLSFIILAILMLIPITLISIIHIFLKRQKKKSNLTEEVKLELS